MRLAFCLIFCYFLAIIAAFAGEPYRGECRRGREDCVLPKVQSRS